MNFSAVPITKTEKNREYLFNPCYLCSQNGSVALPYSHSLSFHLLYNYSKLTIFNSFNFIACEFSAGGNLLEIFRAFNVLAKSCISMSCKHIEDRPEKDGVLIFLFFATLTSWKSILIFFRSFRKKFSFAAFFAAFCGVSFFFLPFFQPFSSSSYLFLQRQR